MENTAQTSTAPKKNYKIIALIVGGILLLVILMLVVFFVLSGNKKSPSDTSNNTNPTTPISTVGDDTLEAGYEDRARQAELSCEVEGHQNYRTQQAFAIDPNNSKVMYLGVEFRGVFKSIDGGESWTKSDEGVRGYYKKGTTEKCIQELGKIVIDPNDSNRLLLSRVDTPGTIDDLFSENAGVYLSEDGGGTWKQLVKGDMNASGSKAIAFDPRDGDVLYYGTNNGKPSLKDAKEEFFNKVGILYKSTNAGDSWTELKTGISNYLRASDLEIDKSDPDILWYATFRPSSNEGDPNLNSDQSMSLLFSEDAGSTWTNISSRLPEASALTDISQSKLNPDNLFLIGQSIKQNDPSSSFYTMDGGTTFKKSTGTSLYAANYDPYNVAGTRLLSYQPFANNTPGVFESKDGGATWKFLSAIPTGVSSNVKFTNITWDPKDEETVYMNGDEGTLLRSLDNGKTWKKLVSYKDL